MKILKIQAWKINVDFAERNPNYFWHYKVKYNWDSFFKFGGLLRIYYFCLNLVVLPPPSESMLIMNDPDGDDCLIFCKYWEELPLIFYLPYT